MVTFIRSLIRDSDVELEIPSIIVVVDEFADMMMLLEKVNIYS